MNKFRLLTPGPTPVPEETLLELARPVFFTAAPSSASLFGEVERGPAVRLPHEEPRPDADGLRHGRHGSGVSNSVPPGGKAICLIAGRWGERWRNLCKAFGVEAVQVTAPYGQAVPPEQLAEGAGRPSRRNVAVSPR